ncbi:MAG: hypothetical protein IBX72_14535 [Nitrospirae bacterium]|nr:hypothetical protein [Nitrospirota bacterium]
MAGKKKFIGYQIVDRDNMIPDGFASFEVIKTHSVIDDFFKEHVGEGWFVVPVYEGDIEEPSFI